MRIVDKRRRDEEPPPQPPGGPPGQDLHDQLLRLRAEFDNAKKRWQREQEERARYAGAAVATDLLAVLDHFEQALKAVKEANAKGERDSLMKGVEMIAQDLLGALQRHGLSRIDTIGQPFDPHLHEAVAEVETAEQPEHHIVEEIRPGYRWHDRVLRHAMVKVAKAPRLQTEDQRPQTEDH